MSDPYDRDPEHPVPPPGAVIPQVVDPDWLDGLDSIEAKYPPDFFARPDRYRGEPIG